MARRFPAAENPSLHPVISFYLLAAGMAAAMAFITKLCGVRFRRRPPRPSPNPSSSPTSLVEEKPDNIFSPSPATNQAPSPAAPASPGEAWDQNEQQAMKELPLPPKMQQVVTPSSPQKPISKSASERKLNYMRSMSIKIPRSLSVVRNREQREEGKRKKEKMKFEESIWTKTIILGEKCKVSEEEEDAVIYDGKGRKVTAYHPRTHSSMSIISISRQCSFADQNQEDKSRRNSSVVEE